MTKRRPNRAIGQERDSEHFGQGNNVRVSIEQFGLISPKAPAGMFWV